MPVSPEWFSRQGLAVLERAANRIIALDPETAARLTPLAGHTIDVELTEPRLTVRVTFEANHIGLTRLDEGADDRADARLRGTLGALITLVTSRGQRSQNLHFEGDIGLIQALRRLVANLEVDWEEQLSQITGDVIAQQLGRTARGSVAWARRSGATLLDDLGEYLTEERGLLPTANEAQDFIESVDRLRSDADRLEARLRRLERTRDGGGGR